MRLHHGDMLTVDGNVIDIYPDTADEMSINVVINQEALTLELGPDDSFTLKRNCNNCVLLCAWNGTAATAPDNRISCSAGVVRVDTDKLAIRFYDNHIYIEDNLRGKG